MQIKRFASASLSPGPVKVFERGVEILDQLEKRVQGLLTGLTSCCKDVVEENDC